MRSDLNLLSIQEIEELENFVKSNLKNYDEEIEELFLGLKSGKLKNKKIEVDALDFIQDGLTQIVDDWINENYQDSHEETMGKIEKIVCSPNTRVGKFLKQSNRKQISLEEGVNLLKKERTLTEVLRKIADTQTRKNKFNLGDHDLNHTKRVLLYASMIMNMRKELSTREREIIFTAIEFHDTGRIHDYEDKYHGERAVENFSNELQGFSEEEQELIKFIIIQHCKSGAENEYAINSLDKSKAQKEKYRLFLNYMKDADKLDRVRFPELSPFMTDSLDPQRLYFRESKQLIKFACETLENTETLFELKNDKSKEALFSRKKVFAELENQEQRIQSVEKCLRDNGYPQRSKNLQLTRLLPQNSKFIKDGYLYLLRGSRQGQMSGFFTYPYANEKKNVEQYLRENPSMTADILAAEQSATGKARFISTTTDITIAASYTKFNKNRKEQGSIYVLKVKPEDAFRVVSPVAIKEFYGKESEEDESEYLIADYVKPEEILKEFKYNEYEEIYEYLKDKIGLDIKKSDISLKENISEQPELSDNYLNMICAENEKHDQYWESRSSELLMQIISEEEGNSVSEKMLNYLKGLRDDFLR